MRHFKIFCLFCATALSLMGASACGTTASGGGTAPVDTASSGDSNVDDSGGSGGSDSASGDSKTGGTDAVSGDGTTSDTATTDTTKTDSAGTDAVSTDVAKDVSSEDVKSDVATKSGACTNDADMAIVQSQDLNGIAGDCFKSSGLDAKKTTACIKQKTGLSDGCVVCFSGVVDCGFQKCMMDCISDSSAPGCTTCLGKNCKPTFDTCSGLSM